MKNLLAILLLCAGIALSADVPITYLGDNTAEWWFEPKLVGLSYQTEVTATATITNYADIITYDAQLFPIQFTVGYDVTSSNRTEDVLFYSANGFVSINPTGGVAVSVATGLDTIECVSDSLTRTLKIEASVSPPNYDGYTENISAHGYIDGSVKQNVNTNFSALVSGHSGSDSDLAIYSTMDHTTTNYVRNTNSWAYPLDLTCCSVWNSSGANRKAGTLITPKHLLLATHYSVSTGTVFRFVDSTNGIYERTAVAVKNITGYDLSATNLYPQLSGYDSDTESTDYFLVQLSTELPAEITPARRFPANWISYLPYTENGSARRQENFPILMTDQYERATIGESFDIGLSTAVNYNADYGDYAPPWMFSPPNILFQRRITYVPFFRNKISGDSGSPMLVYIDGQPIITGTLTGGGGGSAAMSLAWCYEKVQAAIDLWGDTNQWEVVDLSGFTTFGN